MHQVLPILWFALSYFPDIHMNNHLSLNKYTHIYMCILSLGLTICQDCARCFTNILLHKTQDILLKYYYHHFTEDRTESLRNSQKVTQLVKKETRTWVKAHNLTHCAIVWNVWQTHEFFPGKSHYWHTIFQFPGLTVGMPPKTFFRPTFLQLCN